jgi:hypothetical protein
MTISARKLMGVTISLVFLVMLISKLSSKVFSYTFYQYRKILFKFYLEKKYNLFIF